MIPGVTLGPLQAGPVGAGPAAAGAAGVATGTAPFGEFVAWLAQGLASPETSASPAGRARAGGGAVDEPGRSADGGGDASAEAGASLTALVETTLPSPVVVWITTPREADPAARSDKAEPMPEPSGGLASGIAATPHPAVLRAGDTATASPAAAADTAGQRTSDAGVALAIPSVMTAPERDSATAGGDVASAAGVVRDRRESDAIGRQLPPSNTEAPETRGPARAASAAAAAPVIEGGGSQRASVAAIGMVERDAVPPAAAEPVPGPGRRDGTDLQRAIGVVGASLTPPVPAGTGDRDGGPASPPAALPRPVSGPASHHAAVEILASAGLRLRRGLAAAAQAPSASSTHGSDVVTPGGEPALTPSSRGADGASVAVRARDGQAGIDGVPALGHRDRDVLTPASGVLAAIEPRDGGRGAIGVAGAAPAQDGAALDDVLPTQIIRTIRLQWQAGQGEARVQLRPDYLGELTVAVKVDQGAVTATLHAESPEVRRWLEAHGGSLRDALAEQGLRLDRLIVADEHGRQDASDTERRDRHAGDGGEAPSRRRRGRQTASGSTFDLPTFDSPERTPA